MAETKGEKSVLIIDDSEHVRALLLMLLKKEGINTIYQAVDGSDGVGKYKTHSPSLVFLDYMLPKISGLEVLKQIKQYDPSAKVIMLSAVSSIEIAQQAKELGALHYLVKPYQPVKVIELLKKYLLQTGTKA
ncbi:MAG: response regulator [Bacteroidetes bacterium]|nr:response regulator [Bacteroidota bacterium]